jgi:two-component system, LytTR family, response regulator
MKLKSVIVEDETASREILRNYLVTYCPKVNLIGEASTIDEALLLIRSNELDLVFLDVEMPFGNAFDLLDRVGNRTFEMVFVTAYRHYAVDALNHHASYYIMKPISIDELIKAVDYVVGLKEKENQLQGKVLFSKVKEVSGKLTIPQQNGFEVLNIADILYCRADDNYTEIYLKDKKIVVSKTLKYLEDALKRAPFARIHKSYLVNINAIVKYSKGKGGSVIISNGKELLISAAKKKELLSYFE